MNMISVNAEVSLKQGTIPQTNIKHFITLLTIWLYLCGLEA